MPGVQPPEKVDGEVDEGVQLYTPKESRMAK
jgi:hypothetical protein